MFCCVTAIAVVSAALLGMGLISQPAHADDPPLGCSSKLEAPVEDLTQPPNFDLAVALLKKKLVYYRCTSYEADIAKVLDDALAWVKVRAPPQAVVQRLYWTLTKPRSPTGRASTGTASSICRRATAI